MTFGIRAEASTYSRRKNERDPPCFSQKRSGNQKPVDLRYGEVFTVQWLLATNMGGVLVSVLNRLHHLSAEALAQAEGYGEVSTAFAMLRRVSP
jgi:hypothetical protein